ncbi:MAG: ABC transporter permease [Chloroflexi bacterium]|nr:ABC transporter permease [Chloroflexota bacterium]MCH8339173.1 ABC transporter permease [Chloroflexota bacterium]
MSDAAITLDKRLTAPAPRSRLSQTWRSMRRSKQGMIGLTIVVVHLIIALTAPLIVPYSITDIDASNRLQSPSAEHPFGTDGFGRDILSRVIAGGRVALLVSFVAAVIAVTWGGLLGILLGYLGGRVDEVVMRVIDALLAIPSLLLILLVVLALGSGFSVLVLTLGYTYGLTVVRVARGATLAIVARDFITAARARGERSRTIVLRELMPNVLDVLLVEFAMRSSWMLLAIASLSFLGFGISPPTPDWGRMVFENRGVLAVAPSGTFFPVIAISSMVIGINLAADALSKAMGLERTQEAPL